MSGLCGDFQGEEGWFSAECELPAGHPGDHLAVLTWPQVVRERVPRERTPLEEMIVRTWTPLLEATLRSFTTLDGNHRD